jgi:hypothetical protein
MSFRFTEEDMKGLSEEQKDTIIDVVIGGLLAEGTINEDEVAKIDAEFVEIAWGRSRDAMDAAIKASYEKINGFTEPKQAIDLVKGAAEKLNSQDVREKAFALVARVMWAGKEAMSEKEQTVLIAFCVAFHIPVERIQEIGEAVKKGD